MKKSASLLVLLILCSLVTRLSAQALYPVELNDKVKNATLIVEGKVLDQRSFWNPGRTMIFTSNRVEVYKNFKGDIRSEVIEIMTTGGTVGLESIEASDQLTLEKGSIGVFFCYPNTINLRSPLTGTNLYNIYSGAQGFFNYDLKNKTATAPFVQYSSIENKLYKELLQKTGKKPTVVNPAFSISVQAKPEDTQAPVLNTFSPQVVNAGAVNDPANNLLIINGSGFGNTPADQAAVLFDDANNGNGGAPFTVAYNSPLVVSWTDTEIQVRVPSRAGSGNFEVRDNLGVSAVSPSELTVRYAVITREVTNGGVTVIKEVNLMDDNGSGGYTVMYSTGTGGGGTNLDTAPEKATFQRALNTWKEIVGFNVTEGGTTEIQAITGDGMNVVMFDNLNTGLPPLEAGVLATCYSYSNLCLPIATNAIQKTEFDILIRNEGVSAGTTPFTEGPCVPPSPYTQTDLETVILHELGHAINLAHINDSYEGGSYATLNPGKLMHYAILGGVARKSPDFAAYAGALYCVNPESNTYGSCGLATVEMTPLARTVVAVDECPVSFPATATPDNTSVNFDLVHATSNKFADPAYNDINCVGTGTGVTNNAYYAIRSDNDGGNLNISVSGYTTLPASVEGSCPAVGVRLAIFQVNSCPAGQSFPSPLFCRTFNANGALPVIAGLAANTNYLVYVDGLKNTKANFTLALNGTVLPVSLLDFAGTFINGQVPLSWKTSNEINSKEFLLEKSPDGITFSQFAIVPAKGNSTIESSYSAIDDRPFPGNSFYRLKMVDKDGQVKYSDIISIKAPVSAVVISRVFPNPAINKLNLQIISDSRKTLSVEAFDLLGKKVLNLSLAIDQGINNKSVMVSNLTSGTYILQVKDVKGNTIEKLKFLKQ